MNPTLGYHEDCEIEKSHIAQVQLIEAIEQFIKGNWICAITLAGASEAIFAGILEKLGINSVVEDSTEAIDVIRQTSNPMQGKTNKQIYSDWNEARNHLKHHNKKEESTVKLNLFNESYWMIKRALVNANKAQIVITNEQEFENWVIVNINL